MYKPKLLDENESTQFLLSVALPQYLWDGSNREVMGKDLDDLKEVGKDLAKKCRGLPLALVVLGAHPSRNFDISEWKRLTRSVDWHALITHDTIIGAKLDLSFYDMPSHLRSCFMYTTAFPEDFHIDVRLLSNLWVAEGFIPLVRDHTREEVAVSYVTELVQRGMIQVAKQRRSGAISLVKVHDVLRNWGIGRARREGLIKDCHDAQDMKADYSDEVMKAYGVVLHGFQETQGIGTSMRKLRTLVDFTLSVHEQQRAAHAQNIRCFASSARALLARVRRGRSSAQGDWPVEISEVSWIGWQLLVWSPFFHSLRPWTLQEEKYTRSQAHCGKSQH